MVKREFFRLLAIVFACSGSLGLPDAAASEHERPIERTAIIGQENRRTYPEYAASKGLTAEQMKMKFGATGEFHCAGFASGANLVKCNNVLLLTAHSFFRTSWKNEKTVCLGPLNSGNYSQCYFNTVDEKGNRSSKKHFIEAASLKIGNNFCEEPNLGSNDWAIVRLRDGGPLPDVQPYSIFDVKKVGRRDNDYYRLLALPVSIVAMGATNFALGKVPTICDGTIGFVDRVIDSNYWLQYMQGTNCSGGFGTSGGAVVVQRQDAVSAVVGLVAGSADDNKNYAPYGPNNATNGPLIEGILAKELESMTQSCSSVGER